ncbi:zinc finger protein 664-like [Entelurus aequoreus]|uniref:zinc finger protein 664-like n=1 Tax=Entelurus aequoreus TaxID=161455 RepID=UPI002B1D790A|nr:zinc finger protein 664-like [Entelurus aequoreus]
MLKELVKERLMAAADEIFGLFEGTIASYEAELCRTREENERQRQQLEAACKTQIVIHLEDIQQLIGRQDGLPPQPQEGSFTLTQETPQSLQVKEEEEDLWITQAGERLLGPDLSGVSVKIENPQDKPPESSHRHQSTGQVPPSSSSLQHIAKDIGDHCGGSQADNLLVLLSDSDGTTSHCPEDRDNTKEPLSSDTDCEVVMRTHTDNKHSECAEKKTGKKLGNIRKRRGEKTFRCSSCDKAFHYKSDLVNHMRIHTGEKPFTCVVCGEQFAHKSNMKRHAINHTDEKPFICSVCGKRFYNQLTMESHRRSHTGERPFSCSVCNKTFSQNATVVKHMRTHTGEKPYGCSFCSKAFSQKTNMVSHMRIHTGEKPYSCLMCGKSFSNKSNMQKHIRIHGRKNF